MIELWQILRTAFAGLLLFTLGPGPLPPDEAPRPQRAALGELESAVWTGGPFNEPEATICTERSDATCDRFRLEVEASDGVPVCISITTEDPELDDLDLYVYSADGELLAASTGPSGRERVTFEHRAATAAGSYEIRVQAWMVQPGTTYAGQAEVGASPASGATPSDCSGASGTVAVGGDMS